MSLISLINQHAAAAAEAGDFSAVAAKLNERSVVVHDARPVSMARTLAALIAAGIDPDPVIAVFETTPTGRSGLAKLADEGLDYGHPITAGLLAKMVAEGKLPQATADVLTGLSVRLESLAETTADQCREAFLSDRLESRVINATALANERLSVSQTAEEQAAVWTQVWAEGV